MSTKRNLSSTQLYRKQCKTIFATFSPEQLEYKLIGLGSKTLVSNRKFGGLEE